GWTTELVVKALRARLRIVEVPTAYRKRGGGRSKVAGTVGGTLGAGYAILRVVLRYAF
ncbi:MAG: glycosyltransferase family 2 protein, partial [Chloroflexi bacterium]|nr:glycosyltransferase family 2 protein [Chloroflexota bacterium]